VDRYYGDEKLQISDFLRKLCIHRKMAFFKNHLMQQQDPAKFTWFKIAPISQFIDYLTQGELSKTYFKILYNTMDLK